MPILKACLAGRFDGGDVGQVFFEHAGGLVQEGHEKAVHGKPGGVLDEDRGLAVQLRRQEGFLHGRRAGAAVRDHLEQTVLGRVVEVVQADEAVGPGGLVSEIAHVEARGVRGQDGLGRADLVEFFEEIRLDLLVLEDGLDHDVGVGHGLEVGGARDAGEDLVHLLRLEDLAFDPLLQQAPDRPQAALDELVLQVDHHDRDALLGDLLDDSAAHVAGTDDTDFLDLGH